MGRYDAHHDASHKADLFSGTRLDAFRRYNPPLSSWFVIPCLPLQSFWSQLPWAAC